MMEEYKADKITTDDLQGKLIILDFGLVLDGGTIEFYCEDNGKYFWLKLVQHVEFMEPFEDGWIPGALYLNDSLIDIDSLYEKKIIEGLKNCTIKEQLYEVNDFENSCMNNDKTIVFGDDLNRQYNAWKKSPGHAVEQFVSDSLEFLESDDYRQIAAKIGRL